jgi:hypothetical protein
MATIPQTFAVNDPRLASTAGSVHIPDGQYPAVIIASEFKETSGKDGQFLALKVVITQGQYANTEFTERLNLVNKNQTAVEIAYKTLARISEAVGMTSTPQDSNLLHNKPLMIEVGTEAAKDWQNDKGETVKGKDKSIIKKYHALPAVGGFGTPAFAAVAPAPVFAAAQAPAFVAQPVAPAVAQAPSQAPWAK